jgi:dienelactone hydrolase
MLAAYFLVSVHAVAVAETVRFRSVVLPDQWSATISGVLTFPARASPHPVVVFLPPCGGLTPPVTQSISEHTNHLKQAGFAALVLDSYSPRGLTGGRACGPALAQTITEVLVDDAFNAVKALHDHPEIDRRNFFLVGQSLGGAAALKVARSLDIRHEGSFRAVAAYYPGQCALLAFNMQLKSALLVFGAGRDDWTPIFGCEQARRNATPSRGPMFDVIVYADALHGFDQPREPYRYKGHLLGYDAKATADSRGRMVEFFKQNLVNKDK